MTELRRISVSEMAQHKTKEDCWQAYNGKVYNVGPFLKFHPGGGGEMMRGAGKDGAFCGRIVASPPKNFIANYFLCPPYSDSAIQYNASLELFETGRC